MGERSEPETVWGIYGRCWHSKTGVDEYVCQQCPEIGVDAYQQCPESGVDACRINSG